MRSQKCSLDHNSLPVSPGSFIGSLKSALVLSLVLALVSFACSSQNESTRPAESLVGVLYVTGNEPFTFLSIQTEDGAMHRIHKDTTELSRALQKLQGQKLRVRFRPPAGAADSSALIIERYEIVKDH
jgi:hypothetical protein